MFNRNNCFVDKCKLVTKFIAASVFNGLRRVMLYPYYATRPHRCRFRQLSSSRSIIAGRIALLIHFFQLTPAPLKEEKVFSERFL
jgi:hypothetical protein